MPSDNAIAPTVLALLLLAVPATYAAAESAEETIRATFAQWTKDFKAGNADAVCRLFSPELRYDFRGYPERDYKDVCTLLHRSLADKSKRYAYALDIREIMVSGDLAVTRLAWTLNVTLPTGQVVTSVEPGMDVLRKSPDGQWKIIRYIAYEAPERPKEGGQ
jgi:ketosteroid isomerase-like protein